VAQLKSSTKITITYYPFGDAPNAGPSALVFSTMCTPEDATVFHSGCSQISNSAAASTARLRTQQPRLSSSKGSRMLCTRRPSSAAAGHRCWTPPASAASRCHCSEGARILCARRPSSAAPPGSSSSRHHLAMLLLLRQRRPQAGHLAPQLLLPPVRLNCLLREHALLLLRMRVCTCVRWDLLRIDDDDDDDVCVCERGRGGPVRLDGLLCQHALLLMRAGDRLDLDRQHD
jgi:hypothetical protein